MKGKNLGGPWIIPTILFGVFIVIEVVHTKYHMNAENDPHGYCQKYNKNQVVEEKW